MRQRAMSLVIFGVLAVAWVVTFSRPPAPAPAASLGPPIVIEPPPTSPGPAPPRSAEGGLSTPDAPIILHLDSRDYRVTVKASPHGPLFTLHTSSGGLIAKDTTLDKLDAVAPEVADHLRTLHADAQALEALPFGGIDAPGPADLFIINE